MEAISTKGAPPAVHPSGWKSNKGGKGKSKGRGKSKHFWQIGLPPSYTNKALTLQVNAGTGSEDARTAGPVCPSKSCVKSKIDDD